LSRWLWHNVVGNSFKVCSQFQRKLQCGVCLSFDTGELCPESKSRSEASRSCVCGRTAVHTARCAGAAQPSLSAVRARGESVHKTGGWPFKGMLFAKRSLEITVEILHALWTALVLTFCCHQ